MPPAPRVFVPDVMPETGACVLPADEAHHLLRVLRLKAGDAVTIFDGRGREWAGQLSEAGRSRATITMLDEVAPVAEPRVRVTLAPAVLKGDHMDAVIRDATMLGAAAIAPLRTDRVAVPPKAWAGGTALARWQRVALASARQCGRATLPDIRPVQTLPDVLDGPYALKVICVEPAAAAGALKRIAELGRPETALLLIGPEGGWSPAEVALATQSGAAAVSLGPRTLRAETVPVVLLSSLWAVWGE